MKFISEWKILENNRLIIASIIFYKLFMDAFYVVIIGTYKLAYKYDMRVQMNYPRILIMCLLFLLMIPLILGHFKDKSYASKSIMLIWDYLYYIPGFTYLTFSGCEYGYIAFFLLFYLILCCMSRLSCKVSDKVPFPEDLIRNDHIFLVFFGAIFVILIVFDIKYNGLAIVHIFDSIENVYKERALFKERSADYNVLYLYLSSSMAIVIPILIYYFCKMKRYLWVILALLIQLSLFTATAMKTYAFLLVFSFIFLLACGIEKEMVLAGGWVIGFSTIAGIMFDIKKMEVGSYNYYINDYIRRMLFTPNHISHYYYFFFQTNPKIWFSNSILKMMNNYPYDSDLGYVIGEAMGVYKGNNASNGLCGVAYADCGYLGVIIYPFLYGMIFLAVNILSRNKDRGTLFFTCFTIAIVLADSSVFTSLLSHGLALIMIMLLLIPGVTHKEVGTA